MQTPKIILMQYRLSAVCVDFKEDKEWHCWERNKYFKTNFTLTMRKPNMLVLYEYHTWQEETHKIPFQKIVINPSIERSLPKWTYFTTTF